MNNHIKQPTLRWKMLAPEDIELSQVYAFTLNLKDTCESIRDDYKNYLYMISLLLKPYCEFSLYFELSCIGKLHCHGEVIFHDYTDVGKFYYKFGILKHRFAAELDTIENLETWRTYCTKQKDIVSGGLLPNFGYICNKDMIDKEYVSPKLRNTVEDGFFESHLSD